MINTYRDLLVWQKSMSFVTEIYKETAAFPNAEQFALTSQIRRSAISVPSNIAEGYGRYATGDYVRFLQIAMGSLHEAQTQMEIAFNLIYLPKEKFDQLNQQSLEIERMLSSLIRKLKNPA